MQTVEVVPPSKPSTTPSGGSAGKSAGEGFLSLPTPIPSSLPFDSSFIVVFTVADDDDVADEDCLLIPFFLPFLFLYLLFKRN